MAVRARRKKFSQDFVPVDDGPGNIPVKNKSKRSRFIDLNRVVQELEAGKRPFPANHKAILPRVDDLVSFDP